MAEILLEPSSLSKIIPLSFDLNDTNASNAAQLMTKRQFNTADTDAWFEVSLEGFVDTAGSFDITLFNLNDKSVFNHTGKPFTTNPFYYKLDSESDETTNEIRHAGRWIGQIVVTLANGDSATRKFIFDIEGHILDGADVKTILLEDYNALIATINTSKDLLTQYNVDYAALLVDIAAAEAARTNTYNQLVADQQANIEAFDVALDEGIVAANLATKLQYFEETNNSRLLSTERQLADKRDLSVKIKGSDLDTSENAKKVQLINLSEEVQAVMAGTAPVISTVANGSLTAEKYAFGSVDGKSLSEELLNGFLNRYGSEHFEVGSIYSVNGTNLASTTRIRSKGNDWFVAPLMLFSNTTDFKFIIMKYTKDLMFVSSSGWLTNYNATKDVDFLYRIIIAKSNDLTILEDEIPSLLASVSVFAKEKIDNTFDSKKIVQGGVSSTNGRVGALGNRIRTNNRVFASDKKTIILANDENKERDFAVIFYDLNDNFILGTGWLTTPFYKLGDTVTNKNSLVTSNLTYPVKYYVAVRNKDDSAIVPTDVYNPLLFIEGSDYDEFLADVSYFDASAQKIAEEVISGISISSDDLGYKGEFKFKFPVNPGSSYISSHCMVNDELWVFPVSDDANLNYSVAQRHAIDFSNNTQSLAGTFEHNWGHVNSISYNRFTDSLILGNGSGSYSLYGKILIFENASAFKSETRVDVSESIQIDVWSFGVKANVIWGDANNEKGNICYVITNDNKNIRKLLLGQGSNQLASGTFVSGKTGLQYNGTYKILAEYSQADGDDVCQGSCFIGGKLYIGLGHDTLWYTENALHDDGTITKATVRETFYKDDGTIAPRAMQGVTVTDNHVLVGLQYGATNVIYVYSK